MTPSKLSCSYSRDLGFTPLSLLPWSSGDRSRRVSTVPNEPPEPPVPPDPPPVNTHHPRLCYRRLNFFSLLENAAILRLCIANLLSTTASSSLPLTASSSPPLTASSPAPLTASSPPPLTASSSALLTTSSSAPFTASFQFQIGLLLITALHGRQIQPPAIQSRHGNRTLPLAFDESLPRSHILRYTNPRDKMPIQKGFPAHLSTVSTPRSAVDRLSTPASAAAENPRSLSQLLYGSGPLGLQMSMGQGNCFLDFILMGFSKPIFKQSQQPHSKNRSLFVGSSIAPIPDLLGSGMRWNKKSPIIGYIVSVTSYAEKAIAQISAQRLQVFEQCEDSMKSFPDVKFLSNRIYLFTAYIIVICFIVVSLRHD